MNWSDITSLTPTYNSDDFYQPFKSRTLLTKSQAQEAGCPQLCACACIEKELESVNCITLSYEV